MKEAVMKQKEEGRTTFWVTLFIVDSKATFLYFIEREDINEIKKSYQYALYPIQGNDGMNTISILPVMIYQIEIHRKQHVQRRV